MGKVIKVSFGQDDDDGSGYLLDGKTVNGMYVGNISAVTEFKNVYVGTKSDDGIENTTMVSLDEMNQFCLMWLLIFDPNVIKEE